MPVGDPYITNDKIPPCWDFVWWEYAKAPVSHDDNNTLTVKTKRRMTRNQASTMITPRKAITRVSDTSIINDVGNYVI